MGFNECAKTLTDSGGRALGALISRFKEFRDLSFKTFMTSQFRTRFAIITKCYLHMV